VTPEGIPVTLAQAAEKTGRSERTIQRWITLRLLGSYRTSTGLRVVMLAEVMRVEREQRRRTGARHARRDRVLAELRSMS
jgi:hypothetical protein